MRHLIIMLVAAAFLQPGHAQQPSRKESSVNRKPSTNTETRTKSQIEQRRRVQVAVPNSGRDFKESKSAPKHRINNEGTQKSRVENKPTSRYNYNRNNGHRVQQNASRSTSSSVRYVSSANRTYRTDNARYICRKPVKYKPVVWNRNVHYTYVKWYPEVRYSWYRPGDRIHLYASWQAKKYKGHMASVYGYVYEVYYERNSDTYILYFGDYYPLHEFSVALPGYVARQYSRLPVHFFTHKELVTTGLIEHRAHGPEISVRSARQIELY